MTAARTLLQEARGEPLEGQTAVAHVLKNRLKDGRWGHSLAEVCLWRGQFSGWYMPSDPNFAYACRLSDNDLGLLKMLALMQSVLDSTDDPTNAATHYVNLAVVHPSWVQNAIHCGKFGHHDFYRGVP